MADALFAVEAGACGHDFVANTSLQAAWKSGRRRRSRVFPARRFNSGNLEFGSYYL